MFGEMKTGAYVSGAGHLGLFLWLIIGGFFVARDDFEAITVTDVSIITADELQALQPSGPETGDAPPAIEAPSEDQAVETPAPAPAPRPAPEPAPAPAPAPTPEEVPVPDEAPEPPVIEETAQPEGDPGAAELDPDAAPAVPEEADIISQEVTEAPEPEAEIADTAQNEVALDDTAEPTTEPQDAQEQTAPEQTTNQIVTEADETSNSAPTISARPGRKPTPPPAPAPAEPETQVAETQAETPAEEPTTPGLEDLINDAVTEANEPVADNANPGGGTGQPVTRAEKGAFILAIQRCWNVGALSTDALKVTVTVGFTMTPDAKPEINSIQLIGAEGGSGAAVDRAYETARRAIIRCGSSGFGLPADKYDQWRGVEVKFNATTKEIR